MRYASIMRLFKLTRKRNVPVLSENDSESLCTAFRVELRLAVGSGRHEQVEADKSPRKQG
jgi:hypothetical protein